jgi:hypothetical protein
VTRHDQWVHTEDVQHTPSTSAGRNQIQHQPGRLLHDAPPHQWGLLTREALIATNTMLLHAYSISNLGGDGKASVTMVDLMTAGDGTFDTWEHDSRLTAMSLAGGSDWIIVYDNPYAAAQRCVRPGGGNRDRRRSCCPGGLGAWSAR